MTTFLDKLNLRPVERRLVMVVLIVVFVVLNIWFVWPQFKEWERVKADFEKAKDNVVKYQIEISKKKIYQSEQKKLEDEGSSGLLPEEMALQLRRTVMNQSTQSGVVQNGMTDLPRAARGEGFFEEVSVQMAFVSTGEQELIDFLYNLSAGRSMIRVKNLSVTPDQALQKLQGSVTLTASYQKKAPPKIAPPTAAAAKSSSKTPAKPAAPEPKGEPPPKPESINVER